jgi:hypothetical protein
LGTMTPVYYVPALNVPKLIFWGHNIHVTQCFWDIKIWIFVTKCLWNIMIQLLENKMYPSKFGEFCPNLT